MPSSQGVGGGGIGLHHPEIKPFTSPVLAGRFFTTSANWEPPVMWVLSQLETCESVLSLPS